MKVFWVFMLGVDLLIPLTMIGFGNWFSGNTPEEINHQFGYRTALSMKNRETWEFAHHHFGKLWRSWGIVLLPVTVIPLLLVRDGSVGVVGLVGGIVCLVQLIPMTLPVFLTEKALRENFDPEGNLK